MNINIFAIVTFALVAGLGFTPKAQATLQIYQSDGVPQFERGEKPQFYEVSDDQPKEIDHNATFNNVSDSDRTPQIIDRPERDLPAAQPTEELPNPNRPRVGCCQNPAPQDPQPQDPQPRDPSGQTEMHPQTTHQIFAGTAEGNGTFMSGSGCSLTHGQGNSIIDLASVLLLLPLATLFRRKGA